ncbi:MAG: YrbL family protein [Halioglobus sp.]
MLEIDTSKLIGKGLHRECFVHPDNVDWCVKIVVAGNSNENHREAKYYRRLEKRGISWEMLTRFHGLKETNLGEGAVFDLVRDGNGDVSKTLTHYLDHEELTLANSAALARALTGLKEYLMANAVVTMTLKTKNILFQKTTQSDGKLVIVDNVGNSDFIPVTNYSGHLARLKIGRKWRRFECSIRFQHAGNRALAALLD